jgi:iron-sulfur cluster repair protein YtfE (RIC family)
VSRALGLGAQLVELHEGLRRQLRAARAGVRGEAVDVREHCLAFCAALHAHHTSEDGAFAGMARLFPDVAPVFERLRAQHVVVAGLIREFRALLAEPAGAAVEAELDRLAEAVEAHFAYEERMLVPVLDRGPGRS